MHFKIYMFIKFLEVITVGMQVDQSWHAVGFRSDFDRNIAIVFVGVKTMRGDPLDSQIGL